MKFINNQNSNSNKIIRFGEIAKEIKINTKDPLSDGIEKYIGLEHLDPGCLYIKRFGLVANDKPSFTKRFFTGNILFGRRRAYLKKAALADFNGLCSGDIIVIGSKGNDLIPELLPFIVESENFFDWAIKHSAGGLSPRTKFKDLANFEFPLPSKKRQEEIIFFMNKLLDTIKLSEKIID